MRPNHRLVRKLVAVSAVVCVTLAVLQTAAYAPARPGLKVSPTQRVDEREYQDPLIGTLSPALTGTPSGCDGVFTSCDSVPLELGVPKAIKPADSYQLKIYLTWDDVQDSNDLDLYLYSCSNTAENGYGTCSQIAASATLAEGCCETISISDTPSGPNYFITPQNRAGHNFGYKLKAEYIPTAFSRRDPSPRPTPTPPTARAGQSAIRRPAPPPSPSPTGPSPAAVKTYGPDGPNTSFPFGSLERGKTKSVEDAGLGGLWIVILAVGALLVLVSAFFTVRMVRARRAES